MGIFCCGKLKQYAAGELGLIYRKESVTREQLDAWWEKAGAEEKTYIKDITLSKSLEKVKAEERETGRAAEAVLIEAAGNMDRIMPGKLCRGSLADSADEKGCVISKGLAQELNLDGVGQSIWCRDKEYSIRGIIDSREPVCIVQGEEGLSYTRIQIKYDKMPASRAVQMLAGLLPGEADIKAEGDLYRGLGGMMVMIPVMMVFAQGLILFWRIYRKADWNPWIKEACSILFPVLVILGIFLILALGVHFSDDYIPGAWSDFSFWTDLMAEKSKDIGNLLTSGLDYRDREMAAWTVGCLASGVGGALLCSFSFLEASADKKLKKYLKL